MAEDSSLISLPNDDVYLHLFSDIHLEFSPKQEFSLPPPRQSGIHFALLPGDIGHPTKPEYKQFLERTRKDYDHVIVSIGNHEYYARQGSHHTPVDIVLQTARRIAKETDCILLERDTFTFEHHEQRVTFLGCTLWSDIENFYYEAKQGLNDFRNIYIGETAPHGRENTSDFLTPAMYHDWHKRDVAWLQQEIETRKEPLIILTHHCPSKEIISPAYRNHPLNPCFSSNLDHLFTNNIKLWVCGHSHRPMQTYINNIPCGLNPRGYPGETQDFKPMSYSLFKGGVLKLIPHTF